MTDTTRLPPQPSTSDGKAGIVSSQEKATRVYELLAKDHPTEQEFDLLLRHVAPGVLAKRYLSSGLPFVFKDQPHRYLAFREAVGRTFRVPSQHIAVMGSARFGFSTSPRKQFPTGAKVLDENSDMDLVVVSSSVFQEALESFARMCFAGLRNNDVLKSDVVKKDELVQIDKELLLAIRRRAKALCYGYVSPTDLADGSVEKQSFYDMQREAATQLFGQAPPGPINRIGARFYRDWDSAERMYEFSFKKLAEQKGIGVSK